MSNAQGGKVFKYGILVLLIALLFIGVLQQSEKSKNATHLGGGKFIGKQFDLQDLVNHKGEKADLQLPAIIHVFNNTCKYCKNDLALFRDIPRRNDYKIYGLIWSDRFDDVDNFLKLYPSEYDDVLFSTTPSIFVFLGVRGIPITIVIGKDGEIRYYKDQSLKIEELIADIVPLLRDDAAQPLNR